jgi:hypothetical protein
MQNMDEVQDTLVGKNATESVGIAKRLGFVFTQNVGRGTKDLGVVYAGLQSQIVVLLGLNRV